MPELPEVETIRRCVSACLEGRQLAWVETSGVALRQSSEAQRWRQVVGASLAKVGRRGKYLLFDFGTQVAVLHLGMSGRLLTRRTGETPAPHTHLQLGFEGGWELHLVDPRRFGLAVLHAAEELSLWPPLARLGVDALEGDLTEALAFFKGIRAPIRNALLDQRCIAGLGNIYANEALARAQIRPTRPASTITAPQRVRLAQAIRATLEEALAAGGTTLADGGYVNPTGESGFFAVSLAVYGRAGQPCQRCGGIIRRILLAGRAAYYCPRCQR